MAKLWKHHSGKIPSLRAKKIQRQKRGFTENVDPRDECEKKSTKFEIYKFAEKSTIFRKYPKLKFLNGPGPFPEAIGRQKNPWFMWSKIKKLWPNLKAECQPWFMCYSECWWFHILTESPFFRGKSTTIRDMPKTQHTTNLDHQVAAYKMIFKGHIQLNRL